MKQAIIFVILFCFLFIPSFLNGSNPATEVRAIWLTTNWGLDWPSANLGVEGQKTQLKNILEKLRESNFNTVFFQVRIRGDVFYLSDIEPMSPFAKKGFDPLRFAIEECHKRGMECHAWFVTYPVGNRKQVTAHGRNSVVKRRPDLCKFYNGEWYLDPGNPNTRKYILSLVNEIVRNYDIDGIHFDYIRYPEKAAKFPDNDTYKRYGKGINLNDWRRNNINLLVSEIYDSVKSQKNWVQVSSSPIGKYRNLNYGKGNWTAYESVHQDAAYWLKNGKHDALYPMLYYKNEDFYPFLKDWINNSNNRLIVPGLGIYQMLPQEKNWTLTDVEEQIDHIRENKIDGQAYFRAGNITDNTKGINTLLKKEYYKYPAKLPPLRWLKNSAPNSPIHLEAFSEKKGKLRLKWQPFDRSEEQTYNVYYSFDENVDINNPKNIVATNVRSTQLDLDMTYGEFGVYYFITASDRFHNESVPCFPAFFVHSDIYEK